jgi:hypothetical protein
MLGCDINGHLDVSQRGLKDVRTWDTRVWIIGSIENDQDFGIHVELFAVFIILLLA